MWTRAALLLCLLQLLVAAAVPSEWTGMLPGAAPGVQLFGWLFESPRPRAPLLVWLQGGPGASSLFGAFQENGPYRIDPDTLLRVPNQHSWLQYASLLYIDSPAGTGFSQGRLATNGSTLAADMSSALRQFYKSHSEYSDRDLYISGESFAGHMIPQIALQLMREGELPLRGVAMGDGWSSPIYQNGAWAEVGESFGLLNAHQKEAVDKQYAHCKELIEQRQFVASLQYCYSSLLGLVSNFSGNVNVYDIRMGSESHDFSSVGRYLNQPALKASIGVSENWSSFSPAVEAALEGEYSRDVTPDIAALLDRYELKVLVYSGQFDLICCALGTDRWVAAMDWKGKREYGAADRHPWYVNSSVLAGYTQVSGLLRRVVVSNAGHYVPYDQPEASAQMIREFLLHSDDQ